MSDVPHLWMGVNCNQYNVKPFRYGFYELESNNWSGIKMRRSRARQADRLLAEIEQLEAELDGLDDADEVVEDEIILDEAPVDVIDDDLEAEIEELEACLKSSEEETGVEDEITQDSLTEVEDEAGSTVDTEPDTTSVVSSHRARKKQAARRLDRVAQYLEENGRKDLALRIDRLSDSLDNRR